MNSRPGPESAAIVAAIIAMSKSLKLRVVAEGVETRGQMAQLFDQGCHLMQGFLFSPAVPGEDFPALMKAERGGTHWCMAASAANAPGPASGTLQSVVETRGWSGRPLHAGADLAPDAVPRPLGLTEAPPSPPVRRGDRANRPGRS